MPIIEPNHTQYIDLLYLANDNGRKYCLVLADQGSRFVSAVALEDRKVKDIINGLKLIYKNNKKIKIPKIIISDRGSEFLGSFDEELLKMGIKHHKLVKAGRHRAVALAERKIQVIGKIIGKVLTQVQLTTGRPSSKWVEYLPSIVKHINEVVESQNLEPTPIKKAKPFTFNDEHKIDLLNEGDKVRVMLENPEDVDGKTLNGKFRSGDVRWDKTIRTVKYIMMKPDQPIMYFLDSTDKQKASEKINIGNQSVENVGYTRNQLQKVSKQEKKVENVEPLFENEPDRAEIQKIKERGINELNETMYLVKFKQVRKPVWIKRENLVEDLGASYMNKLDKKFDNEEN